jgi:hypothetical protein
MKTRLELPSAPIMLPEKSFATLTSRRAASCGENCHIIEFVYMPSVEDCPKWEPVLISTVCCIRKCCGLKKRFSENAGTPGIVKLRLPGLRASLDVIAKLGLGGERRSEHEEKRE